MSEGSSQNTFWTVIAAVGGLLSGVAAVLALFIAKPETISIFVPTQVLREAVSREERVAFPDSSAANVEPLPDVAESLTSINDAEPSPVEPVADPSPPAPPTYDLGGDLSVSLLSVAENQDRFIATLRFENSGSSNLGVAVLWQGAFQGEMVLTDGVGGSCPMAANGEGWGTLSTEQIERPIGSGDFRAVPPGGRAQHTIFFNKGRCDSRITTTSGLAISGSFVVSDRSNRRAAPIFIDNISVRPIQ